MLCHSVGCGTASQTRSATQSSTQIIAVDHIRAVICVYDAAGNVIETHEHKGGGGCAKLRAFSNYQGRTPEETLTRGPNRACKHLAAGILSKMPDLKIRPARREGQQ